jgi:phage anti-repressor protein
MSSTVSFKDFLKTYSLLSNEFIDDFYNIYNYDEGKNNDLIINLEIVAKWLNSKKGKLKETLIKSYDKNFDYIIKLEKNAKISKSNKEIIYLTPDCFKRLCLLSKTKKAEEVRTYYLELENMLNNYKNYIIKGLKNTVEILENNQREIPKNTNGVVYILRSLKDINGVYRFGQTNDFKKRLNNYNSHNSDKMKVVKIYETKNIEKVESCVIGQIKELRYKKRKDFYQIDLKLLTKLIKDCKNLTLKYKNTVNNSYDNNLLTFTSKKTSKKTSKNTSKNNSKKTSKKQQKAGNIENMYMYIKRN